MVFGLLLEHPGIFAAAALRRVDDERAFSERDAREAARHNRHLVAEQDVRPQVHVAWLNPIVDETGRARERERRLRDEVAWFGQDLVPELCALGARAVRADEHSIATRLPTALTTSESRCSRTYCRSEA